MYPLCKRPEIILNHSLKKQDNHFIFEENFKYLLQNTQEKIHEIFVISPPNGFTVSYELLAEELPEPQKGKKVSALREETFYHYPDWAVRELLLNAVIHRDYQLGNAPIKFYDYNGDRLEISNPGGLYGLAKPDNFPSVNDYRNPLLAGAMKVEGFVNKYNRGIAKVKQEMEANGNPPPVFDVNKFTEFRVTLRVSTKVPLGTTNGNEPINGTINGTINVNEPINGTINVNEPINGTINVNEPINGTINANEPTNNELNGTINDEIKIFSLISMHPGIQRKELSEKMGISLRTLARLLQKMTFDPLNAKIEHRGSNKTGGWFPRT